MGIYGLTYSLSITPKGLFDMGNDYCVQLVWEYLINYGIYKDFRAVFVLMTEEKST